MKKLLLAVKISCVLLSALLLAGCAGPAGADSGSEPADSSPPAVSTSDPEEEGPAEPVLVDDPSSPYPMAVQEWTIDMDGDGVEELVQLRAEKAYVSSETEPKQQIETTDYGLHPYTLVVTREETVYELPLSWKDVDGELHKSWYFSSQDSEFTGTGWTSDQAGNPVLCLWFDTISAGGAGRSEVYAAAFQDGAPVLLPVPEFGIESTLDEETMIAQLTVPETGYTESLDLMQWLEGYAARNTSSTVEPSYSEDGALQWPVAPRQIDSFYYAETNSDGLTVRQYVYGTVHMDGMGDLVTTLSWDNGEPVVLNQHFEWYY